MQMCEAGRGKKVEKREGDKIKREDDRWVIIMGIKRNVLCNIQKNKL